MSGTETPSDGQLLHEQRVAVVGSVNVATPGRVVSYDAARGFANVQPDLALRLRLPGEDGYRYEPCPVVEEVPVVWPVWGGQSIGVVGHLVQGDYVTLVCSDKSLDEWKRGAAQPIERLDPRRHQITDAYALVGGFPGAVGPPSATAGALNLIGPDIRLGQAGAADPVVTESRLQAELSRRDAVFNTHVHPDPTSGSTGVTPTSMPSPGELGSPTVKAP